MRRKLHGLTVRRAGPDDLPVWAAMLAQLHSGTAEEFEAELATLCQLEQPYIAFLAFEGDEAVGVIDARERNYAEGAPNLRAFYVEDLWVEPSRRGFGVARALLEAVESWAQNAGFDWLASDTTSDNLKSQNWHRKMGFQEEERLVVYGKPIRPQQ